MKRQDTAPIIREFGQWAVTTYGVECLEEYYPIDKCRLFEDSHGHNWSEHMREKRWVNQANFGAAMEYARTLYPAEAHA